MIRLLALHSLLELVTGYHTRYLAERRLLPFCPRLQFPGPVPGRNHVRGDVPIRGDVPTEVNGTVVVEIIMIIE